VIANAYNIPNACTRLKTLLHYLQAVSISTPPFMIWFDSAASWETSITGKPTALSAGEARELYQLALANKVIPTLDLNFALSPHGSNWQTVI